MAKKKKPLATLPDKEIFRMLDAKLGRQSRDEMIAKRLERGRRELLEENNRLVILNAMYFCLEWNEPFPGWLIDAFRQAIKDVWNLKLSWNDAFGNPLGKADKRFKQREALKLHENLALPVYLKVREFQAQNKSIDFGEIAKEIDGATESIAKRVYYENQEKHLLWEGYLRRGQEGTRLAHEFRDHLEQKLRSLQESQRDGRDFAAEIAHVTETLSKLISEVTDFRANLTADIAKIVGGDRAYAELLVSAIFSKNS